MLRMQVDEAGPHVLLKGERLDLTPQQAALVETIRDSDASVGMIAVAGSGKTFSLRIASAEFDPKARTLACAFNKHNQLDLASTLPDFVVSKTFNGIGHTAWQRFLRKRLRLDPEKVGKLCTAICAAERKRELWGDVRQIVEACKGYGITPLPEGLRESLGCRILRGDEADLEEICYQRGVENYPEAFPLAMQVLEQSIRMALAGEIDFSDQIYMSVCWKVKYEKYDNVLVDEAQDLNPLNHVQVRRSLAKPDGRLIVVGDPRQSIYGFRGSVANGMQVLMESKNCEERGLTVCFRCAKAIVESAQELVPHIEPAEDADEGEVVTLSKWTHELFKPGDAILCRNNAPLVATAFYLVRNRVSVRMLGRDIGRGLQSLIKRIMPQTELSCDVFWYQLEAWEQGEVNKALARQDDHMVDSVHDKAQTIREVGEAVAAKTVQDLLDEIENLFSRTSGSVTLSTVHKAKGKEWPTVYLLDRHLIPPPWLLRKAKQYDTPELLEQEHNVDYVARTRAKHTLCFIYSSDRDKEERQPTAELHETTKQALPAPSLKKKTCGGCGGRGWRKKRDKRLNREIRIKCGTCNGKGETFAGGELKPLPPTHHQEEAGFGDEAPKFLTGPSYGDLEL